MGDVRFRDALSRQARTSDRRYRGEAYEDEMVGVLSALRLRREPRRRVDRHAAPCVPAVRPCRSPASGLGDRAGGERQRTRKLTEFNKGRPQIIWVPWQRPGFELALMLKRSVEANPGCDGLILGGHGLFTWGDTQKECYLTAFAPSTRWASSSRTTRIAGRPALRWRRGDASGRRPRVGRRRSLPVAARRGVVEPARDRSLRRQRRRPGVRELAWAEDLCQMGTSCPDHFLRTRISPMFIPWNPGTEDLGDHQGSDRRPHHEIPVGLRGPTTKRSLSRTRPGFATATRPWW